MAQRHFTGSSQKARCKLDQSMVATASSVSSMAPENAIESLYRHSIEAASQFVEDQMPSMLRLAQHELMPPPLPRAEAERHQIRPSWLMLLTGLLLLAGGDMAFADAAADANAAYQRGDYARPSSSFVRSPNRATPRLNMSSATCTTRAKACFATRMKPTNGGIGRPCMAMLTRYASSKISVVRNSIREEKARYRASIASMTPATTMIC